MTHDAKHTPGPWGLHMHGEALGDDVAHISGPHGCAIAMVHAGAENINQGREHYVTREEARADARLIAAAPELLEALKMCLFNGNLDQIEQRKARAAIAKAEGKE